MDISQLILAKYDLLEKEPEEEEEERQIVKGKFGKEIEIHNLGAYPVRKLNEKVFETDHGSSLMKHPFFFVLLGPSSSGKTTAWLNLLTRADLYRGFVDRIYFFVPTWYSDEIYEEVLDVHENDIFDNFDLTNAERILKEQKLLPERKILFVIDDALAAEGAQKLSSETIIQKLATTGRKYNASVIYSTQNLKQCINPIVRENMTHLAMFFSSNQQEKKKCFKEIRGLQSEKEVEQIYDACFSDGKPHHFLFVSLHDPSPLTRYRKDYGNPVFIR